MNPPEVCDRTKELVESGVWDNPIKVSEANMEEYDAIVMAGGLGAVRDWPFVTATSVESSIQYGELLVKALESK